jgi:hypothetical protein
MLVHVLAVDYDGTIAARGRVAEATAAALSRVRDSGRRIVLVTGRMLPDLRRVCPEVDRLFDAVVAENGALLYLPARREARTLGDAPEPGLVAALRRRGVDFVLGSSIIASHESFAEAALAAIREVGVERSLVFNRGALMLLPGGVSKGTGLLAALRAMELSPHNVVGIGDAENDHAFLALCELAVAVADAIPAVRERADWVTAAPDGAGVVDFIERHVLTDLRELAPRLARHALALGDGVDGAPVTLPAHGTALLIVGPSAAAKSTLAGVLVERLVQAERAFCLLDPEGDHEMLGELPGVVVRGGQMREALPAPAELEHLLRARPGRLVLNLSALSAADKAGYAARALGVVAAAQNAVGQPHWLIVDEAHHIFPAGGSPAAAVLPADGGSLCLITLAADRLAPDVRRRVNAVAATNLEAFHGAVALVTDGARATSPGDPGGGPLGRGEAVLVTLDGAAPAPRRFRVARHQVQHRRHVRTHAEGELPPDRSFYFRGAGGKLNLRAPNLLRFVELAEGVDEGTWAYHLHRGDYSRWLREVIKDAELADEVREAERAPLPPAEARRRILDAVRARYGV